jgi:hypothetical protein
VEGGWAAAGCLRGEKKACGLGGLRAERERGKGIGPAGKKGERGKVGFFLFLLNSFQIRFFFKHSNFNQTEIHAFES